MTDEEPNYDVAVPFVCVASEGGPYDDKSFAAGVEIGVIYVTLRCAHPSVETLRFTLRRPSEKQADLMAMHCGFTLEVLVDEADEPDWIIVQFTRSTPDF